jgi:hypothetical protein
MKKIFGFTAALMLILSTLAYAGGGKVCGDNATGSAGSTGGGAVTQNRAAD